MAATSRSRVLVVEDDQKLARTLVAGLEAEGFHVQHASTAEEGFLLAHTSRPHLLLLDVTLPHRSGLDILRQMRSESMDLRIILLTSHNTVEDRVLGLTLGADDYLGKPFSFPELLARIHAQLRRAEPPAASQLLQIADLTLDSNVRSAHRGSIPLELTTREFDLLLYLVENQGHTVSREMLLRDVWKESARYTPLDNVIDVQIARLRRKLDDGFSPKLLHTVRGIGFVLRESGI